MAKFIPVIDEAGIQSYFTDAVRKRGIALEDRTEDYLRSMHIQYKRQKQNGIDFIIEGNVYLDCVAQGTSGSISDKLPTKCFKYIRKYSLKEIYILHPYSPITKDVAAHLEHLENTLNCIIHIIDWADFTYLMNGGRFEKRKPYNHVKNSVRVGMKNAVVKNITLNKFYDFNNK